MEVGMLSKLSVVATLPAANIDRAKKFYSEKLGLTPDQALPDGSLLYKCKDSAFVGWANSGENCGNHSRSLLLKIGGVRLECP